MKTKWNKPKNKHKSHLCCTKLPLPALRMAQFTPFFNLLKTWDLPQCLQLEDTPTSLIPPSFSIKSVTVTCDSWKSEFLKGAQPSALCLSHWHVVHNQNRLWRDLLANPVCSSSSLGFSLITSTTKGSAVGWCACKKSEYRKHKPLNFTVQQRNFSFPEKGFFFPSFFHFFFLKEGLFHGPLNFH